MTNYRIDIKIYRKNIYNKHTYIFHRACLEIQQCFYLYQKQVNVYQLNKHMIRIELIPNFIDYVIKQQYSNNSICFLREMSMGIAVVFFKDPFYLTYCNGRIGNTLLILTPGGNGWQIFANGYKYALAYEHLSP